MSMLMRGESRPAYSRKATGRSEKGFGPLRPFGLIQFFLWSP